MYVLKKLHSPINSKCFCGASISFTPITKHNILYASVMRHNYKLQNSNFNTESIWTEQKIQMTTIVMHIVLSLF